MIVRVRFIGDGHPRNPTRAPLPTWSYLGIDHVNGTMEVMVPEEDLPDGWHKIEGYRVVDTIEGPVVIGHSKAGHQAWHDHLDKRYKERSGEFRPELV